MGAGRGMGETGWGAEHGRWMFPAVFFAVSAALRGSLASDLDAEL